MKKDFSSLYEELKSDNEAQIDEVWYEAKEERKKHDIITTLIISVIDIIILLISYRIIPSFMQTLSMKDFNQLIFPTVFPFIIVLVVVDIFVYILSNFFGNKKCLLLSQMFKKKIINGILNNFYDNVNYSPEMGINQQIYKDANYKEYYNRYHSEDYLDAKIDNQYAMKMAEVKTIDEETRTDSRGNRTTSETIIFHGLFLKIELNKSIKNRLVIKNNNTMLKKDRLEMDSQEFEKYFDVSSDNNIIGMQILTADLMELLVNYKKQTEENFDIIIDNNIMYLRFHTGKIFELESIKKGALDKELIQKYFNIIQFTYDLNEQFIKAINETEI